MKVQGIEIPQVVEDDTLAFIKGQPYFRSFDVQRMIEEHPMIETLAWKPVGLAMRVADRIIQHHRKAGNIGPSTPDRMRPSLWRWIGE